MNRSHYDKETGMLHIYETALAVDKDKGELYAKLVSQLMDCFVRGSEVRIVEKLAGPVQF